MYCYNSWISNSAKVEWC